MTFEEWFDGWGFQNFKAHEFTHYFKRDKNTYPPAEYWDRIVPALKILDELRNVLGQPITITSSYRSPAYNDSVGGAEYSQHKEFRALDFQVKNTTPHEVMKILRAWRDAGMFKGGLGGYSSFTHIDTRGHNVSWGLGA
jgi:uncharacterized protein YcbK (DUF882 family)